MLQKPDLSDQKIVTCLQTAYGLAIKRLVFLPLGADPNTAVYQAIADDEFIYFVKLRRASFDETSVALPKFLNDQGIVQVIAPLPTQAGQLWATLNGFRLILYPFVEGGNGYEQALSREQWRDFGNALKRIHQTVLPAELAERIQRECYSDQARLSVKNMLLRLEDENFVDMIAKKLADFLQTKRHEIVDLVERAEQLAQILQVRGDESFVICHSDIHAGNLLIANNGLIYIVDWDNPIFAPKERDLMFIGGGQGFIECTIQEEEQLFYAGYGQVEIDAEALAYYRYERIVQDIAAFCEEILETTTGIADREQSLSYLMTNFLPGITIEIAYQSDKSLLGGRQN